MTDRRHQGELVSVLRLSDDADEDHWARTARYVYGIVSDDRIRRGDW